MPDAPSVADLRESYERGALDAADLPADPFDLFAAWFADAQAVGTREPNAMTLATATADGRPLGADRAAEGRRPRVLLLHQPREPRRASELDANARAALVFWWPELERQVRVEGPGRARSRTRPPTPTSPAGRAASRLGAWASPQSRPVPDRRTLEVLQREVEAENPDEHVPRPGFWGGFRVVPDAVEFWQGRTSRLHDRHVYRRDGDGWTTGRLAP